MNNFDRYFTIAQITDLHVGREIQFPSGEVDLFNRLEDTVAHLNSLFPLPDLVFVTGDMANHGIESDYIRVRDQLEKLKIPYFLAVGNHDNRQKMQKVFNIRRCPAEEGDFIQYVLEDYPVRIIVLDTLEPGTHFGLMCDRRNSWLDKKLSENTEKPTIIFMHHPPFDTGMPYPDSLGMKGKEEFASVVRKYGNIVAIASGHTHREASLLWAGTAVYVTPASSFSYKLEFGNVDDLDPLLEPAACRIFRWGPDTGLVSHLSYIGKYEYGLTEGVPEPPEN